MEKIVLITGATSGIGLATAKRFGKEGYTVIANGIDPEQIAEAKKEFAREGIKSEVMQFDVTDEQAVGQAVGEISQRHDHLDTVVNCAGGLGGRSRFEDMTTEFYRHVLALNLDSVFYVTRACIPLLKKGTDPSIINFASNAAQNAGGPGAGIYGTSKAAVLTLTRAFAKDLAEYGIRANGVSPGTINTPFHDATRKNNPALFESWKNNILLKRFGTPEEVANVVYFLAGKEASFLTGEIIQVNGGQDFI